MRAALAHLALAGSALAAAPPGPGPFGSEAISQPVPGAPRGVSLGGWRSGRLCDVTKEPYRAVGDGTTNATAALQQAIDDCGDLTGGGTVLVPEGSGVFPTASLWLRSNLTLRVEAGATLLGTALKSDAPMTYTRRECVMTRAHAGMLNAGRCLRLKSPLVGWDDCAEWSKLENLVIEGGGTLDANALHWVGGGRERPVMLDLLWVNGLTLRDLKLRRSGFWTIHPTFSNNVRVTGMDVRTRGLTTDGIDPDSSWNVYIADNVFDTGDDCIAIKAGRDWSGIMVNISSRHLLIERNRFLQGRGVSIGSETSGWVQNVTIRDSSVNGTERAVRIKSRRGRGGGVSGVLYENLSGVCQKAISLTLHFKGNGVTNDTATPELRDIVVRNMHVEASDFLECKGWEDSPISGITLENVTITGRARENVCLYCNLHAKGVFPEPCRTPVTVV